MEILDFFYSNLPIIENFTPRKIQISSSNYLNLYGAHGVGKSTLALDYLHQFDKSKVLYIDFENPNMMFVKNIDIERFVSTNGIDIVVFDHFNNEAANRIQAKQHIIITREPMDDAKIDKLKLMPLDFEEFLAFENAANSATSFTNFLKSGSLPQFAKIQKTKDHELKEFVKSRFNFEELRLLAFLSAFNTRHISIHQIYTMSKEHFKLSKDWLYTTINRFQSEGILYFVEDTMPKPSKKLIFYDTALAKYLNRNQTFMIQFDAALIMELIKREEEVKTFYNLGYLNSSQLLTIPAPFESEESIWAKSQKKISHLKKEKIKAVNIITVANSFEYTIDNIIFEAMPFYEWSLADIE